MREHLARYGEVVYFAAPAPRRMLTEIADELGGGRVQFVRCRALSGRDCRPHRHTAYDEQQEDLALMVLGAAAAVFSLPALLVGWALSALVWRASGRWSLAGLLGVGLTVALCWSAISAEIEAAPRRPLGAPAALRASSSGVAALALVVAALACRWCRCSRC